MSRPAIEAFEQRYAERSGVTVDFLHAHGRFGWVCSHAEQDECDAAGGEGFEMLHLFDELVDAGWTPPASTGRRVDVGDDQGRGRDGLTRDQRGPTS